MSRVSTLGFPDKSSRVPLIRAGVEPCSGWQCDAIRVNVFCQAPARQAGATPVPNADDITIGNAARLGRIWMQITWLTALHLVRTRLRPVFVLRMQPCVGLRRDQVQRAVGCFDQAFERREPGRVAGAVIQIQPWQSLHYRV